MILAALLFLFLLAAPMLIFESPLVLVPALALDLLDHPKKPPAALIVVLGFVLELEVDVGVELPLALALAAKLELEPDEILLSHEGSKDETRCMAGNA